MMEGDSILGAQIGCVGRRRILLLITSPDRMLSFRGTSLLLTGSDSNYKSKRESRVSYKATYLKYSYACCVVNNCGYSM